MEIESSHALAVGLGVFVASAWAGRVRVREWRGRWARLAAVSLAFSLLAVAPLALLAGLEGCGRSLAGNAELRGWVGLALSVVLGITLVRHLQIRTPLTAGRGSLPELEDVEVLERVGELADAIGSPRPRVRVLSSLGSELHALAWASSLVAPVLTLTDGILHRLGASQRDAIVAHELAHVARRSVWGRLVTTALCALLAVIAMAHVAPAAGIALFVALNQVLNRVRSRWDEVACDRRAASAVGPAAMSEALGAIHATQPLPQAGLLAEWIHATSTHPPLTIRRQALARLDPAAVDVNHAQASRLRGVSRAALALALVAIAAALAIGQVWNGIPAAALLLAVAFAPRLLVRFGVRKTLKLVRARFAGHERRLPGARLQQVGLLTTLAGLAAGWGAVEFESLGGLAAGGVGFAVGLVLIAIGAPRNTRARALRRRVVQAYQAKNYAQALAVGAGEPERVAQDPLVGHNLALAAAVSGDRQRARRELEALGERLPISSLSLAVMLLGSEPETALALAERDAARLPGDPRPLATKARALRKLGRLEEATRAVVLAREHDPRDGNLVAVAAAIAMDSGQFQQAGDLLVEALALAPGSAYPLLVRAELAVAADEDWAPDALADARRASRANPFAFLDHDLERIGGGAS